MRILAHGKHAWDTQVRRNPFSGTVRCRELGKSNFEEERSVVRMINKIT